jgi:hypothetical protein
MSNKPPLRHAAQEIWALLLVLLLRTLGAVREGLCGVLLVLLIDCMAATSNADPSCQDAAFAVFKLHLQQGELSALLPQVVPRLSDVDKGRLRSGVGAADARRRGAVNGGGAVAAAAQGGQPRIDFAAFG